MLLKWFTIAAILIFSAASVISKELSRKKRSDDFIPCERGWFHFRDKCFKASGNKRSDKVTWESAKEACAEQQAILATIQSKEENDFIVYFLLLDIKEHVWIGINDRKTEGEFVWEDTTDVNYTNWRENQPSGAKDSIEDCGEMTFFPEGNWVGTWNDNDCDYEFRYICQKKTDNRLKNANPQYCASKEAGAWKFQDSCYQLVMETKSWEKAEQYCQDNFKGHLVTISDKTVDRYLNYILSNINQYSWVGVKMQPGFQQKWSSGWYVGYSGVEAVLRDYAKDMCVVRKGYNIFTTVSCSNRYSFVCEVSKDQPPVLKPAPEGSHCPEVPPDWRDLGGEYCYFIETKISLSWAEANFECRSRGGDLVSIHSKEETKMLSSFVKYRVGYVWIGLYRSMIHDDDFVWSDGSPLDYQNWKVNEPNSLQERCGELNTYSMGWNDISCGYKRGYVCSVLKVPSNPTFDDTEFSHLYNKCTMSFSNLLTGLYVCILLVIILFGLAIYNYRRFAKLRQKKTFVTFLPENSYPGHRKLQEEITNEPQYEEVY